MDTGEPDLWQDIGARGRPEFALPALRRVRAELDDVERGAIGRALIAGWTCSEVARVQGVSRQAVFRRLQRTERQRRPRAAAPQRARRAAEARRREREAEALRWMDEAAARRAGMPPVTPVGDASTTGPKV
jgi:hypothetical protein